MSIPTHRDYTYSPGLYGSATSRCIYGVAGHFSAVAASNPKLNGRSTPVRRLCWGTKPSLCQCFHIIADWSVICAAVWLMTIWGANLCHANHCLTVAGSCNTFSVSFRNYIFNFVIFFLPFFDLRADTWAYVTANPCIYLLEYSCRRQHL